MCLYNYICIHTHTHTHTRTHTCPQTRTCSHTHAYTNTCTKSLPFSNTQPCFITLPFSITLPFISSGQLSEPVGARLHAKALRHRAPGVNSTLSHAHLHVRVRECRVRHRQACSVSNTARVHLQDACDKTLVRWYTSAHT